MFDDGGYRRDLVVDGAAEEGGGYWRCWRSRWRWMALLQRKAVVGRRRCQRRWRWVVGAAVAGGLAEDGAPFFPIEGAGAGGSCRLTHLPAGLLVGGPAGARLVRV